MKKLKLYTVKDSYIDHLRLFDSKVRWNKDQSRPYIGTVLDIDQGAYYAPLTSPKPKHKFMQDDLDFILIKQGQLGAINLGNMIPVKPTLVSLIDFETRDEQYRALLYRQAKWLRQNSERILQHAIQLRTLLLRDACDSFTDHDLIIRARCCNLPLLEEQMMAYGPKG